MYLIALVAAALFLVLLVGIFLATLVVVFRAAKRGEILEALVSTVIGAALAIAITVVYDVVKSLA